MFLESILQIDQGVHTWFNGIVRSDLTSFFSTVTLFGNWWFVMPLAILVCVFLYWKNHRRFIMPFVSVLLSAEVVTYVTKIIVARPRALDALVTESDYSFPSGHAMIAVALYGFLIYLETFLVETLWVRRFVIGTLVLLILLIGLSRLYLGVHYLSDIFAGYCIGGLALFVSIRYLAPHRARV
jgi:undecaprenyl-diphosphatase